MNRLRVSTVAVILLALFLADCPGPGTEEERIYTVSIGVLIRGTIAATPLSGTEGTEISLEVAPDFLCRLSAGSLSYNDEQKDVAIDEAVKKFPLPAANITVTGAFEGISGTYTGRGMGRNGSIILTEGHITGINIDSHSETPSYYEIAVPEIPNRVIAVNSPEVDTVSGATVTSNGIIRALRDALSKAL